MGLVHASTGRLAPASDKLLSEPAIVTRLARATLPAAGIDWAGMERNYDVIRDHIAKAIPGPGRLQHQDPRDSRADSPCPTRPGTTANSGPRRAGRRSR